MSRTWTHPLLRRKAPPYKRLPCKIVLPEGWFTEIFLLKSGFTEAEMGRLKAILSYEYLSGGQGWSKWGIYTFKLGSIRVLDKVRAALAANDRLESKSADNFFQQLDGSLQVRR